MPTSIFTLLSEAEAMCPVCREPVRSATGSTAILALKMPVFTLDVKYLRGLVADGNAEEADMQLAGGLGVELDVLEQQAYHIACFRTLKAPTETIVAGLSLPAVLSYVRANVITTRAEMAAASLEELVNTNGAIVLKAYLSKGVSPRRLKVQLQTAQTKVTYTWYAGRWAR